MTTAAAEALYLAQHLMEHAGRGWIVHNPENRPVAELPVIYGFNNGGSRGMLHAVAMAADGTVLGGHCCSSEGYMLADLAVIDGWMRDRHEKYRAHYPAGYRMEFVSYDDVAAHEGLQRAFKLNAALPPSERG
jgi:hypothetical protein